MTGYVYRIDRVQRGDGPGVRTVVRLKGCPLRCAWCDRPDAWAPEPELVYAPEACIRCLACIDDCGAHALSHRDGEPQVDLHACRWCGDCADGCPTDARRQAGSVMTDARVLDAIVDAAADHAVTGGGVTFSGGEPLMQPAFLVRLLEGCRALGLHTAVDTCGYAPRPVLEQVAARTDLVLYDLKHLDDDAHRAATGMPNRMILDNLAWLARQGVPTTVRVAIVPGFNDETGHLQRLGAFVAGLGLPLIEVLPYRAPIDGAGRLRLRTAPPAPRVTPSPHGVAQALSALAQSRIRVAVADGRVPPPEA